MATKNCIGECLTILRLMKGDPWEDAHNGFYSAVLAEWSDEMARAIVQHCANTMTFRPSRAELIDAARGDDGRPGAEEAWALLVWDEQLTAVLTEEMNLAQGIASSLHYDDPVGARMAFKETYTRLVSEARAIGKPVVWTPSFGWNKQNRVDVLRQAIQMGRIEQKSVQHILEPLPDPKKPERVPCPCPPEIAAQFRALIAAKRMPEAKGLPEVIEPANLTEHGAK